MTDPHQIAAALSKAQKRAVMNASFQEATSVYRPAGLYLRADKRVRYNLACKGVIRDYLAGSHRLTPLGLQVRAILEQRHD